MPRGSALFVFQNAYEPTQCPEGWVVHYKDVRANVWKSEKFGEHEKAYDFYYKKTKELEDYYNVFLRDLGIKR